MHPAVYDAYAGEHKIENIGIVAARGDGGQNYGRLRVMAVQEAMEA